MALKDDVKEHLRLNDLSPEETSTASLAGSLGAHPAEIADVLDELAADVPLTADDIRDHYRRVRDVYTDIAALDADPEARTGGVIDNSGWYDSRSNADDFAALEEGYDQLGSPYILESAANEISREGGGRVLYAHDLQPGDGPGRAVQVDREIGWFADEGLAHGGPTPRLRRDRRPGALR